MTSGPAADGAGDAPLASPGARWTEEEDEELVAAVRAVADLAVIAEQRGRTRGAIVSRLLRMIPAREDIPEEEQFGWIMARLADPCFDWRTPPAHPRPGRRGSDAPATPEDAENLCRLGIGPAERGRAFGMRRAGLGPTGGGMIFGLWA